MLLKHLPAIFCAIASPVFCLAQPVKDSTQKSLPALTCGLHSQGFVPFSGVVLNRHPMFDALFTAPLKPVTFFFYKSFDTQDYTTGLNYITTGFLKTYSISKRLSATTAAFYCISQAGEFWDSASDAGIIVKATYKISRKLSVENLVMAGNLTRRTLRKNLVNRLEISYQSKIAGINLFAWYYTPMWGNKAYVSISPEIVFNQIKLSKNVTLSASVAYFTMLLKGGCNINNSFIFNIKLPVNF